MKHFCFCLYLLTTNLNQYRIMGCFLVIGIATEIVANKAEAKKQFKGIENFKTAFEEKFNASGIYQMKETESRIILELKPDIMRKEWVEFIQAFYNIRYITDESDQQIAIEAIAEKNNAEEWYKLAEERCFESYQELPLYYYPMESPSFWGDFHVGMDLIILSLDGKIIMECYNSLCEFFTRIIREKLTNYLLSDSLFVYISE